MSLCKYIQHVGMNVYIYIANSQKLLFSHDNGSKPERVQASTIISMKSL